MLTIPREGLVWEWYLNWDAIDTSIGWDNWTATDVTWVNSDIGYQSKVGSFNGSSSKIDVPWNEIYRIAWDLSLSFWVKIQEAWKVYFIIECYDNWESLATNVLYSFHINDNNTFIRLHEYWDWNNVSYNFSATINANEYYHILLIRDTNLKKINLYINWELIEQCSYSDNPQKDTSWNTQNISIWYHEDWSDHYLNWQLWLLRIYNRMLSEPEIKTLYLEWLQKLSPSRVAYPELFKWLVGYWDFRNGDLSNLVDWSLATNNWATLTTDHLGYKNCAYSWWTWDEVITTKYNVSNIFTHTVVFKVISDTSSNGQVLLECKWSDRNNRSFIAINRNSSGDYLAWSICFYGNDGNTDNNLATDADNWINDWKQHIVSWTRDGVNNNKLYLDWNLLTTNWTLQSWDITSSFNTATHFWRYGWQSWWFNWDISLIMTHNRVLSDSEIKLLHQLLMQ